MTTPADAMPRAELILFQTEDGRTPIFESRRQIPSDGTRDGVRVELFTRNEGRRGFMPQAGGAA